MAYRLVAIKGPIKGRTFVVVKTETRIGRDPTNDLVLADDYVSRLHATIVQRGDQHLVINGSPNGTLVNGKRVEQAALRTGDEIGLGAVTVLRYDREVTSAVVEKAEAAAKAAAPSPTAAARAPSLWRRRPKLLIGGLVYLALLIALAVFLATRRHQETVTSVPTLTPKQIDDDLVRPLRRERDAAEVQKALRRGMALCERRHVDPKNLYQCIVAFKEAEAHQGNRRLTDPEHIAAYQNALKELGKKVDDLFFQARALQNTGRYNDARDAYVRIQQTVPDPESAIFRNATEHLKALEPFIERPRWSR